MGKSKPTHVHDIGRGQIQDCAVAAVVTSALFRQRIETPKKGKGSYSRKGKGRGLTPYQNALQLVCFGKLSKLNLLAPSPKQIFTLSNSIGCNEWLVNWH